MLSKEPDVQLEQDIDWSSVDLEQVKYAAISGSKLAYEELIRRGNK